jgi:acetylornithine deacetylase
MSSPPDLITQLTQLVAASSVSSTQASLDQSNLGVINALASWLTDLGFVAEILPLPGQAHKANLIASLGQGPGGLVLAGHTDTVPYDEHRWRSDPLRLTERDNKLYGLGTCDMKGFFPLIIEAARAFDGADFSQPLIVLATADEESSMAGAMALVEMGRPAARYAVIGEPTGMRPVYQHKSILMESIEVVGQAGHSSDPALGRNALEAMQDVIARLLLFRENLQNEFNNPKFEVQVPTLNLGCIHGGDNPNRICSSCELHFDVRLLPGMSNQAIRNQIAMLVNDVGRQRGVDITLRSLINGVEAFAEREDSALVQAAQQITGYQAETTAFATEAPYFQQLGLETLVLGPGNIAQAHQPDEYLALAMLEPCISTLKQLIQRFCLPAQT